MLTLETPFLQEQSAHLCSVRTMTDASPASERNVVIREIRTKIIRLGRRRLAARRATLRLRRTRLAGFATSTELTLRRAAFGTATEHLHLVGNDVGGVLLDAILAGVLVVADRPFHVDLAALAKILGGDLAELAEEGHPVPFGAFLGIALAILADAGGGQAGLGDRHAALRVLGLRIVAQIADQDDLVDATCHGVAVLSEGDSARNPG